MMMKRRSGWQLSWPPYMCVIVCLSPSLSVSEVPTWFFLSHRVTAGHCAGRGGVCWSYSSIGRSGNWNRWQRCWLLTSSEVSDITFTAGNERHLRSALFGKDIMFGVGRRRLFWFRWGGLSLSCRVLLLVLLVSMHWGWSHVSCATKLKLTYSCRWCVDLF